MESDNFENRGVGGNIILKRILKKLKGDIDWICQTQDRDKCWPLRYP
jgi:hypothetical protein